MGAWRRLKQAEKQMLEELAEKVFKRFGYDDEWNFSKKITARRVDVIKLVNFFGFTIEEKDDFSGDENASISISEGGSKKVIAISKSLGEEDKRFAIAHEFAHFLLNCQEPSKEFSHHGEADPTKVYVDYTAYLASLFLLPPTGFQQTRWKLHDMGYRRDELKQKLQEHFCAPLIAVNLRDYD